MSTTGTQGNISDRLKSILPPSWFPFPNAPNTFDFLQGFASIASGLYSLIVFAKLQTRISTATGFFLDLMSFDFFGRAFPRNPGESDAAFSAGIKKELLRVRATRQGISQALIDLTGQTPIIFEPTKPSDTGAYRYAMGYSIAGRYGSMLMPYQALVNAFRPGESGIPSVAGYGSPYGGYGVGAIEYADLSMIVGAVTDAQIFARVASVMAEGTMPWTNISNAPGTPESLFLLDSTFILDVSTLAA